MKAAADAIASAPAAPAAPAAPSGCAAAADAIAPGGCNVKPGGTWTGVDALTPADPMEWHLVQIVVLLWTQPSHTASEHWLQQHSKPVRVRSKFLWEHVRIHIVKT
jgi:hypothetical protein